MTDLIEFLRARLGEDERAARLALGRPMDPLSARNPMLVVQLKDAHVRPLEEEYGSLFDFTLRAVPHARHFVLESKDARVIYDPERMLREVETKRKILDEHAATGEYTDESGAPYRVCRTCSKENPEVAYDLDSIVLVPWPCLTLRALASIWSDHPDYREEWRP